MVYAIVIAAFTLIALGGFLYSRYARSAKAKAQLAVDHAKAFEVALDKVSQDLRNDL